MDVYMGSCVSKYSAMWVSLYIYVYIYLCVHILGCRIWMFFNFLILFHFIENGIITGGINLGYFSGSYWSNSLGTPAC